MPDELPPIVTRLLADLTSLEEGLVKGKALVKSFRDDVQGDFSGGREIGSAFGKDLGSGIADAIPAAFGGPGAPATTGQRIGKDLGDGIDRGLKDSVPAVEDTVKTKVKAPLSKSGKESGAAFSNAFRTALTDTITPSKLLDDSVVRGFGQKGDESGKQFSAKFSDQAKNHISIASIPGLVQGFAPAGDKAGFDFTDAMGGRVRGQLPAQVEKPVEDSGRKAGQKAGKAAGDAAAQGMSPLILDAFAAAASAGPGLLLAGTAAAVVGAGALIDAGNAQLQAGFAKLGQDGAAAVTDAARPLIPSLLAATTVLDDGIAKIGPELKDTFTAVIPDATALTGGLVSLVSNTLPGLSSGLRAIGPYAKELGDDFGRIGSGIGGLFAGLGQGAAGGTTGFTALTTAIEHLLPDIGEIIGDLSNGLGPALHDIVAVADPAAHALTAVVGAIPPGAIRGVADAVAVLYAAFKVGKIAGVVGEGATFTQWLGVAKTQAAATTTEVAALGAAEEATAAKGGLLAAAGGLGGKAITGLGAAAELATGPLGLIIGGAGILGNELGKLAGVGQVAVPSIDQLTASLQDAAYGSGQAQDQITKLTQFLTAVPWGDGAQGIKSIDTALMQLQQTDPQAASREFYQVQQALEAQGKTAAQVTALFPQYTHALNDATLAAKANANQTEQGLTPAQQFTQSLIAQQQQLATQARTAGDTAVAAISLGGAQSGLNTAMADAVTGYTLAKGGASAYNTVLTALNETTNTLLSSEASFTIALDGVNAAAKANGHSLDVNNTKGAQNIQAFTGIATAADKAAVAIYQNEVGTKGANIAFQDANTKLAQEKQAFIDAADKAGFNQTKVKDLANELFQLPSDIPIDIDADTQKAISAANGAVRYIDSLTGTITVQASNGSGISYNPKSGGGKASYGLGGWVNAPAGQAQEAVVHGQEYMLSRDMLAGRQAVDPRVLSALRSGLSSSNVGGYAPGPGGGGQTVNLTVLVQAGAVLLNNIQLAQTVTTALAQAGMRLPNQNISFQNVRGLKPS